MEGTKHVRKGGNTLGNQPKTLQKGETDGNMHFSFSDSVLISPFFFCLSLNNTLPYFQNFKLVQIEGKCR